MRLRIAPTLFVLLLPCLEPSKAQASWQLEPVDSTYQVIDRSSSIALDHLGNPHVAYLYDIGRAPAGSAKLKYAVRSGGVWITETVYVFTDFFSIGGPILKLDSADNPHILYGASRDHLAVTKYAVKINGQWSIEEVTAVGEATWPGASGSDMDLGPDDLPHICVPATLFPLKYAMRDAAGVWHVAVVDSGNIQQCRIAVDPLGNPHLCYNDHFSTYDPDPVKYAVKVGSSWVITVVDSGTVESIAIDEGSHPHILYNPWRRCGDVCLNYAVDFGGGWTIESTGASGYPASLAVGRDGRPCASYITWDSMNQRVGLEYASRFQGVGWFRETIEPLGSFNGGDCSMALDDGGYPQISYSFTYRVEFRYTDGNGVRYAARYIPSPSDVVVDDKRAVTRVFPNPTHAGTTLTLRAPFAQGLFAQVIDARGRLLRTLNPRQLAREVGFDWDGGDSRGRPVAAGAYFIVVGGHDLPPSLGSGHRVIVIR